jgi:hypothetical protein
MRLIILAAFGIAMCGGAALADDKPSADELAKIKEIVTAWGCEGGTFEKETESTGMFEADDVKCRGTNYDFKISPDYKVVAITAD